MSSFCKKTRRYLVVSLPRCFKMPVPLLPRPSPTAPHPRHPGKKVKDLHKSHKQTDKIFVSSSHATVIPGMSPNFTFYLLTIIYLASFWWAGHCIFPLAGLCRHMFLCHLVISVVSGRSQVSWFSSLYIIGKNSLGIK